MIVTIVGPHNGQEKMILEDRPGIAMWSLATDVYRRK